MLITGASFRAADIEEDVHCPYKTLIVFIFERALSDIIGSPESTSYNCDEKNKNNVRRRARRWLFSRSTKPQSAEWWAALADLEYLLTVCREAVLTCEAEGRRFLIGRREHGTGRAKFSRDREFEYGRSILSWRRSGQVRRVGASQQQGADTCCRLVGRTRKTLGYYGGDKRTVAVPSYPGLSGKGKPPAR